MNGNKDTYEFNGGTYKFNGWTRDENELNRTYQNEQKVSTQNYGNHSRT